MFGRKCLFGEAYKQTNRHQKRRFVRITLHQQTKNQINWSEDRKNGAVGEGFEPPQGS
jgi:hypothetical protein